MEAPQCTKPKPAMTFIELLLTILAVVFLVGIFLPVPPRHKPMPAARASLEMAALVQATRSYESEYKHWPIADSITNTDVTCGITSSNLRDSQPVEGTRCLPTNSDLIVALMDWDVGANAGHKLNPKRIQFLSAKKVEGTSLPGVSSEDHQYRDPWGNPYVISLDANDDGFVRDACYAHAALYRNSAAVTLTNRSEIYELDGSVMVWSCGPDGMASYAVPDGTGVNKDNVVSWR